MPVFPSTVDIVDIEAGLRLTFEAVNARLWVDSDRLWLRFDTEHDELFELRLSEDLVRSRAISLRVRN